MSKTRHVSTGHDADWVTDPDLPDPFEEDGLLDTPEDYWADVPEDEDEEGWYRTISAAQDAEAGPPHPVTLYKMTPEEAARAWTGDHLIESIQIRGEPVAQFPVWTEFVPFAKANRLTIQWDSPCVYPYALDKEANEYYLL